MSLATALKDAVAYARLLQDPDFRRLWGTQIITMIGAQRSVAGVFPVDRVGRGRCRDRGLSPRE
jgi:hypothetical protein